MPRNKPLPGLRIGHLNVYHLVNKIPDITVMLNNNLNLTHVLGLSETRLREHINDGLVHIPNYGKPFRRDIKQTMHTGLAVYVHESIHNITSRRRDLELDSIESLWIEIKTPNLPSLLVANIYIEILPLDLNGSQTLYP